MKIHFTLVLVLLITPLSSTLAETLNNLDEMKIFTQIFVDKVASGEVDDAIAYFGPYSIIKDSDLNVLKIQIKTQLAKLETNLGICIGSDYIGTEQLGSSFTKIIQLQKFNIYAIRWMLVFYNNGSGWKVVNISFDDKIMDLFAR